MLQFIHSHSESLMRLRDFPQNYLFCVEFLKKYPYLTLNEVMAQGCTFKGCFLTYLLLKQFSNSFKPSLTWVFLCFPDKKTVLVKLAWFLVPTLKVTYNNQ